MGNYDKACNNVGAVRFVQEHMKVCEIIAKELDVPVENILGSCCCRKSIWYRSYCQGI
ncbi:Uncharacterised protein [Salmonella enterica subsp. enterica]|nr:Uncharacterised protein [Salmonella enterica subsp. enterica]